MSKIVIYHANCVDGFTAAWCAWRKFGEGATYLAAQYGDPVPAVTPDDDVVIVDFSYPRAELIKLYQSVNSLLVLDHHKTAQADCEGLEFCRFDMHRSGAGIAWDELHPHSVRPKLVDYVEDRDLWRWRLESSREISAWISSWKRDGFSAWELLAHDLAAKFNSCKQQGAAILRALDGYVESLSDKGMLCGIGGHVVPVINTTHAASELVGKMAEAHAFAAGWFQRQDGKFVYSLRSRGDFDVSEVAKQFGGGGHKHAAGFTVYALIHERVQP